MKSCIKLTAWVSRRLEFGHGEDSEPQQKGKLQNTLLIFLPAKGGRPTLQKRKREEFLPSHACALSLAVFLFYYGFLITFISPCFHTYIHHTHILSTLSFFLYSQQNDTRTIKMTRPADTNPLRNSSQAGEYAPFSIWSVLKSDLSCKKQASLYRIDEWQSCAWLVNDSCLHKSKTISDWRFKWNSKCQQRGWVNHLNGNTIRLLAFAAVRRAASHCGVFNNSLRSLKRCHSW